MQMLNPCICNFGAHFDMVICVVIGCSKRSDRDKDVSFYRIPTVRRHKGKRELELLIRRRDRYLAAISTAVKGALQSITHPSNSYFTVPSTDRWLSGMF